MSWGEPEPKKIQRTNSGRVIVFDPCTQTLTTEKAKRLKGESPEFILESRRYNENNGELTNHLVRS